MQDMGGKPVLTPAGRAAKKRKLRSRGHAKKWIAFSGVDGLARVREAHLELLEQTNRDDLAGAAEEDGEYDAPGARGGGGAGARERGGKKKRKRAKLGAATPRGKFAERRCPPKHGTLADVLLRSHDSDSSLAYVVARASAPARPARRLCCIKGVPASYRDPASGLSFSSAKAFGMIKEHPPPWVKATANTPHFDALRHIRDQ